MTDAVRLLQVACDEIVSMVAHGPGFPQSYIENDLKQRKKSPAHITRRAIDQLIKQKKVYRADDRKDRFIKRCN